MAQTQDLLHPLRTVPTIVTAHTGHGEIFGFPIGGAY